MMVGLHGHCFRTTVLVMSGIANLGVDCLPGGDIIRHMGGVAVIPRGSRGWDVAWGKPRPEGCCRVPGRVNSAPVATAGRSQSSPFSRPSLSVMPADADIHIEDSDFVADFRNGKWMISWRWVAEPPNLDADSDVGVPQYEVTGHPREIL